MAQQQAADDEPEGERGLIMHSAGMTGKEFQLLIEFEKKLGVALFNMRDTEGVDPKHVKKLEKLQELLDSYDRVILAFPNSFQHEQLVMAINMMVKRERAFVTVIMYRNEYCKFPHDLDEFKIRRVMVDKAMQDTEGIAEELNDFIKKDPEKLNLEFLNFGNGLAWSYYFGYLTPMLEGLDKIIMESKWRKEKGQNVDKEKISKRMLIYPRVEIPKNMLKLGHLIFHRNQVQVNRAGIDRIYEIDIREVKSQDGSETYYGVADYANCLQLLLKLRAERTEGFLQMDEAMMEKHGRFFYNRVKLFLESRNMQKYNEKYMIESSKYELMDYNDSPKSPPEDELVEDLFQKTKLACRPRPPPPRPPPAAAADPPRDTGIICLPGVDNVVRQFIEGLQHRGSTLSIHIGQEFAATLSRCKKVFMVLTDELVNSNKFDEVVFYVILHHVCTKANNRRLLVCLDCLVTSAAKNHPCLQLLSLFKCISYNQLEWEDKIQTELAGPPQEITYDLMFHNIGTGFSLSYYYAFLKFRIPGMSLFVQNTPELMRKFEEGLMSYKLFILHPHSCKTEKTVSKADPRVVDRDDDEELKRIKFPELMNDRRVYSPKINSIIDPITKKKYFVFVEFSTQAETLHRMMTEGFLDENLLSAEWARYCNKLNAIIAHPNEPMGCNKRMQIIPYDDTSVKDIADTILESVKVEIEKENRVLIGPCPTF